jgi:hypothetical protein
MNNLNTQDKSTMESKESKIIPLEISNLATALCKAQGIMTGAKKDKKNPFFKSTYADLASVFDAIRDPFTSNGLSVTQTMDVLESGRTVLCTRLMHSGGEYIDSKMLLPDDPNPQKLGSAITYYRRYSLMAIAGLPPEDDDGNAASGKAAQAVKYINSNQVAHLESLINGHTEIRKLFLENCNGDMNTVTIDRYPGAVQWIKKLIDENKGN